jgi:hypothetical protein
MTSVRPREELEVSSGTNNGPHPRLLLHSNATFSLVGPNTHGYVPTRLLKTIRANSYQVVMEISLRIMVSADSTTKPNPTSSIRVRPCTGTSQILQRLLVP